MSFGLEKDDPAPQAPALQRELIAGIKPRPMRQHINLVESDMAAEAEGFSSREPGTSDPVQSYVKPLRKKRKPEPKTAMGLMLPVSVHTKLRDYADSLGISYPAAIEKLWEEHEMLLRLQAGRGN